MKFALQSIKNGCRLGTMTEMVAGKSAESPMCILYTRTGSVPYLGRDVLDKIEGLPILANTPLGLIAEHADVISGIPQGLKSFCGLSDFGTYLVIQDPAVATPSGYNERKHVSVWGKGGKAKLDVSSYIRILESMKMDWAQSLCDSDTDHSSSNKRVRKSVDRTLEFLDEVVSAQEKSQKLENTQLVGVIEGGHLLEERLRSARETAKRPVSGFAVEGFHQNGPESEKFSYKDIHNLLSQTLAILPENKPRFLSGIVDPENVLLCVQAGFDIFDASYPYIVAERGCALVFKSHFKTKPVSEEAGETSKTGDCAEDDGDHSWEICLQDKKFVEDFGPLMSGCSCYACTHHTRAYINHLLCVSELLASVLLMIHNTHRYLRYFEDIRAALASDTLEDLKQLVTSQKLS